MMSGSGAAVYPSEVSGAASGHRNGRGHGSHPYGPQPFLGGMDLYGGVLSPATSRMLMQSPLGGLPFGGLSFHGLGNSRPFDRCNGGNCGHWGGCHGGHCGEFYDFRPCQTPECFYGSIHGFDCSDGFCKRVCNGPSCRDFVIHACSGKGSPTSNHSGNVVSDNNGDE
ncbi:unnamed protein product [Hydatigera taeniaeformis]|uniref:EGF-like domain-containing protein n=1 Tax=Hydatigena taeniaeformis TaxID=6205 RepID=A0A0R3WV72_HYDTA|nr:unnamed protein product [Hydatigera taeniaeformis]